MKRILFVLASAAYICFASCTREINNDVPPVFVIGKPMELTIAQDDCLTRTVVKNDTKVWWEAGDAVGVYASGKRDADKFISTLEEGEAAETSRFTGVLSSSADKYYVLYPYTDRQNTFNPDEKSFALSLPAAQTARAGSFNKDLMPSFGSFTPSSTSFKMHNLAGGLRFRLSRADINQITFAAHGEEGIAGDFTLASLDAESVVIDRAQTAVSAIVLKPATETFEVDTDYYILMVPGELSGFTVSLTTTGGSVLNVVSNKSRTIKPGALGTLAKALDEYADGAENEYVDLGLSVKWATCNLGASVPEEYGDYFAWGEVEPKPYYDSDNYKWLDRSAGYLYTKYNSNEGSGTVDNKMTLEPEDDAAHVILGGDWRMPTATEVAELIDTENCSWEWTEVNGINGYRVTSKKVGYTDNSIFIPSAGRFSYDRISALGQWGQYWSLSNYHYNYGYGDTEWSFGFRTWDPREDYPAVEAYFGRRSDGLTIRPVYGTWVDVTGIKVPESVSFTAGEEFTLDLEIMPADATDKIVRIISSDASIVNGFGSTLYGNVPGTATITVYTGNGLSASCNVTVTSAMKEPEPVDMGLSVKWASCNLGATASEGYGEYYAWGETEPHYQKGHSLDSPCETWLEDRTGYNWESYSWWAGTDNMINKYCTDGLRDSWGGWGDPDEKIILDRSDDAAHINLGGDWRMPTEEEWDELIENCTYSWTEQNGVNGLTLSSKINGNSIFLPASGVRRNKNLIGKDSYTNYWTASFGSNNTSAGTAWAVGLNQQGLPTGQAVRYHGHPIRPVNGKWIEVTELSVPKSLNIMADESFEVKVGLVPADANDKSIRLVSSDTAVVTCEGMNVNGVAQGYATVTAYSGNGVSASFVVTVSVPVVEPEAVDLGLSVKWANLNLGAAKPEDGGNFYAWGETSPVTTGGWNSYTFGSSYSLSKYNVKSDYGAVDGKTILDPEDDAARVILGGSWRMPTVYEVNELVNECTWTWVNEDGVTGYKVSGKKSGYTDKSIFIPAAGFFDDPTMAGVKGVCWSSSLYASDPSQANHIYFDGSRVRQGFPSSRCCGFPIRPVSGDWVAVSGISVPASVSLKRYASTKLEATVTPGNATVMELVYVSSNPSVVKCTGNKLYAMAAGTATVTAYSCNGISASCEVTVTEAETKVPEAVDLGLSVLWSPWNLGAVSPEEFGCYYSWAETEPKESYGSSSYKYGRSPNITRYNTQVDYGTVDNKTSFADYGYEDDAARALWGNDWRVPAKAEIEELMNPENCAWQWTTVNGVAGYLVTSLKPGYTNKSVFFPSAGYFSVDELYDSGEEGYYWSSDLYTDNPSNANRLYFNSTLFRNNSAARRYGYSVRPVVTKPSASLNVKKYLTFTSEGTTNITLRDGHGAIGLAEEKTALYYSYDKVNWAIWDYSDFAALTVTAEKPLYLCGNNPDGFNHECSEYAKYFAANGSKFGISGDIMSLIDCSKDCMVIPYNCCFYNLFYDCSLLTSAPYLPATTLTNSCYASMFYRCFSLEEAPSLPATKLVPRCYQNMFGHCESMVSAPNLPATTLADSCYEGMFSECHQMKEAPSLPATTLANRCYQQMFEWCRSLETPPALPATELAEGCYEGMFLAADLYTAPNLPATKLEKFCYKEMLSECIHLSSAPALPATNLAERAYESMFSGCISLSYVICNAIDNITGNCEGWLDAVHASGTFVKNPAAVDWTTGPSGIPEGWDIELIQ